MIIRLYDASAVKAAIDSYDDIDVDVPRWLEEPDNIALVNEDGDIALFEFNSPSVYCGHYFFTTRGKTAKKAAKNFLRHLFIHYDCKVILGLTPIENLGARWMSKQIGFKSYGVTETSVGPCELVILTKQEWEQLSG